MSEIECYSTNFETHAYTLKLLFISKLESFHNPCPPRGCFAKVVGSKSLIIETIEVIFFFKS